MVLTKEVFQKMHVIPGHKTCYVQDKAEFFIIQPYLPLLPHFSPHHSHLCNLYFNPKCLTLIYLWAFLPAFLLPNLYLQLYLLNSHSFSRSPFPKSLDWGPGLFFLRAPFHSVLCSTWALTQVRYSPLDSLLQSQGLAYKKFAKWIKYRSHSANYIPRSIWIDMLFSSFSSIMSHFHLYVLKTQAAAILSGL